MTTSEAPACSRPAKIASHHLERWAIVYVRQSHPQQIQRHRESAQVQVNLQQVAFGWGWPRERIRILDGDQGCSGTSTVGRDDFAWLLSEIALGHVGIVLGFQINRLAREDEVCCRLISVCATFDTLLADQDGVYDPHHFNDRLVLTVKGFMGGLELHEIQQRMQASRLNRASRGEWMGNQPPGYVIGPDSKLQLDPDEQVQSIIRLILDQFACLGSISGLLRYLRKHHIEMPYRVPSGPNRGQLQWHRPHRETLRQLLRRPAYAGAYTWGRRALDPRRKVPGFRGRGRVERQPHDCAVFLSDNHPAYITWEQFQSNVGRLRQQRMRGPVPGPARRTASLLAGLVVCGSCGCRMQTRYTQTLRYDCQRHALDYGARRCQSLVGEPLEQLVAEQILQVVTPASLELILRATEHYEQERAGLEKQWRLNLERARQQTARACRQYDAVEPENRLVARTLERKWEEALLAERAIGEDYRRFQQEQPARLSVAERAEIEALTRNLPAVWHSVHTGVVEKRQVVRLLLEQVVVKAPATSQEVTVHLHWSHGTVTEHKIIRPVGSWGRIVGAAAIREQVQEWRAAGWTSRRMATELNATGYRTPRGRPFTAESIRKLLERGGAKTGTKPARTKRTLRNPPGGHGRQEPPMPRNQAAVPVTERGGPGNPARGHTRT